MALLALDVGSKRIGVAMADPSQSFALPLTVIERTSLRVDLQAIAELVRRYDAAEIVVGDPLTLAGERGPAAQQIDRFVEELRGIFAGPIHRVDERMTTAAATKELIAGGVRRARRRSIVDKMAAALILESFLARRKRE